MIVRSYIACQTCNYPHMPRVQVGINPSQVHVFNCLDCNEPIKLYIEVNIENASARVVPLENCKTIDPTDCKAVYLCADFVAHPDEINSEFAFPSFRFIHEVSKNPKAMQKVLDTTRKDDYFDILSEWREIQKFWRLSMAGKNPIAGLLITSFTSKHKLSGNTLEVDPYSWTECFMF